MNTPCTNTCEDDCAMRIANFLKLVGTTRGAHPNRIQILLFCREPQPSGRIADSLNMPRDATSKQLKRMLKEEMVTVECVGNKRLYQTDPAVLPLIAFSIALFR